MKKTAFLLLISLLASAFKAYSQDAMKTLFHPSPLNYLGLYVAPEFQYGQLHNENATFGGVSVMLLLNKSFAVGASFQQNADRSFSPSGISPLYLHARYGGLKMEYTILPNSPVHISFPLLIGAGSANTDSAYHYYSYSDSLQHAHFRMDHNNSTYLMIQPGVVVEANLLKYVKLYAGAYYRFSFATDNLNPLPASTLQGFSAAVGLKIGLFDYNIHRKKSQ